MMDPNMMGGADPMAGGAMGADPNAGMGMDPMAGGDPNAAGSDPNTMGADPNAAADPNAGMDPNADPNAMGADPMAGGEAEGGDDSTMSIFNQLSPDDKEAARAYMESMLARDETQGADDGMQGLGEPAPAPDQAGQGVMMEITKGRLKKVQQRLHETFRSQEDDKDETDRKQKKVKKNVGKKSPFDSPLD
jgi:hypothetical protein